MPKRKIGNSFSQHRECANRGIVFGDDSVSKPSKINSSSPLKHRTMCPRNAGKSPAPENAALGRNWARRQNHGRVFLSILCRSYSCPFLMNRTLDIDIHFAAPEMQRVWSPSPEQKPVEMAASPSAASHAPLSSANAPSGIGDRISPDDWRQNHGSRAGAWPLAADARKTLPIVRGQMAQTDLASGGRKGRGKARQAQPPPRTYSRWNLRRPPKARSLSPYGAELAHIEKSRTWAWHRYFATAIEDPTARYTRIKTPPPGSVARSRWNWEPLKRSLSRLLAPKKPSEIPRKLCIMYINLSNIDKKLLFFISSRQHPQNDRPGRPPSRRPSPRRTGLHARSPSSALVRKYSISILDEPGSSPRSGTSWPSCS